MVSRNRFENVEARRKLLGAFESTLECAACLTVLLHRIAFDQTLIVEEREGGRRGGRWRTREGGRQCARACDTSARDNERVHICYAMRAEQLADALTHRLDRAEVLRQKIKYVRGGRVKLLAEFAQNVSGK